MRFLPPTPPPRHKPVEDMASVIASLDCKTPDNNRSSPSTPGAFAGDPCFFSRGAHTFRVPANLHEDNRKRAIALLKDHPPGIIVLVGGIARTRNDSDHEELFRQESYFQNLFGVKEPGWVGCLELPSGTCTLFAPELPKSYAVWMGGDAASYAFGLRRPRRWRASHAVDVTRSVGPAQARSRPEANYQTDTA